MMERIQNTCTATPLRLTQPQEPPKTVIPRTGLAILSAGFLSLVILQTVVWANTRHLIPASLAACAIILVGLFTILHRACHERTRTEQLLREYARHHRRMFDAVVDGMIVFTLDGTIVDANPTASKMHGYPHDQFIGLDGTVIIHPQYHHLFHSFRRQVDSSRLFSAEVQDVHKDGSAFPVEVRGSFFDFNGRWHILAVVQDVSLRNQSEAALRELAIALAAANRSLEELNRVAEAATRAKSEFLANMSHEIRTPMTAILGYADILANGVTLPENVAAVQTIRTNGKHLLMLLNDILDISKIEAGKLSVECITCEPASILADVISLMRLRAIEKGIGLKLLFDGPCPKTIRTDPTRLRQIVVNLVGNAIKFTERGEVRVIVRLADHDTASPRLECEVCDTGIGMTSSQLEGLFQPFEQADASMSRRFGGTGLGLAISQRLAKLLGGELIATSQLGHGSQFRMLIAIGALDDIELIDDPVEVANVSSPKSRASKAADHELTGLHILVAEDGNDNQRLLEFVLTQAGAQVTLVDEGQKALNLALATLPGRGRRANDPPAPFDVVLMDMQMPVVDGYEATRHLRAAGYTRPIIALTAHCVNEERRRCLEAGCSDFATKPVNLPQLLELVAHWATRDPADSKPFTSVDDRTLSEDATSDGKAAGDDNSNDGIYSDLSTDPDFAELVDLFVQELPQRADTLRTAAEQQDWNRLAKTAHQLKGAAGSYGFDVITDRAAQLETAVREDYDETAVLRAFDELLDTCARARAGAPEH